MTTISIHVTYDPQKVFGATPNEKLDNLIMNMSEFMAEMQALGCEVSMSINGQTYPVPAYTPDEEQAS